MNQKEYLVQSARTEVTPNFVNDRDGKPSAKLSQCMHAAMGMVTEAGEAMDHLKKYFIYGVDFDPINLLEECGDKLWYQALMLRTLGYDFADAFERNIRKLHRRFPGKFTQDAAINRDLAAEREELERHDTLAPVHGSTEEAREWLLDDVNKALKSGADLVIGGPTRLLALREFLSKP